jgi:hypothetical protein
MDVTAVFECVLRDNAFMLCIDNYIQSAIADTKIFDVKHVPQVVLMIMTLLNTSTTNIDAQKHIKDDGELQELLHLFYDYIINKIKEKVDREGFNKAEFKHSFDICCRLAILKFKFSNKTGLFCIGK